MANYCSLARIVMVALLLLLAPAVAPQDQSLWKSLREDGVHDPRSPAVKLLQEPREALSAIADKAPDPHVGNQVRWVKAIEASAITPRSNILPETQMRVLDKDIYLNIGGSQPVVRFPHRAHTYWLDCSNCHEHLFKSDTGATKFTMFQILEGDYCGRCHGAVAFPLTECQRCHSVSQVEFAAVEGKLGLKRSASGKAAR